MATRLSVSEARAALPEILGRVSNGEEVVLTRHGQPVAVVVRPDTLRLRRGEATIASAAELRQRITAAARVRRPPVKRVSRRRAEALLDDVRGGRARS